MRYERQLKQIESDEMRANALLEECEKILTRLEGELQKEPAIFQDLFGLMRRVAEHLLRRQEKLKEGIAGTVWTVFLRPCAAVGT